MINSNYTQNDLAWDQIFGKYKLLDIIENNGTVFISSSQINEYRESRLMTKFDHKVNLPQIFKKNKLSILPVSRGKYVIGRFDSYHCLADTNCTITKASLPDFIQSIEPDNIFSESTALNYSYASMILGDFLNEEKLLPTISGRMRSDSFSYEINDLLQNRIEISVSNSQIEIDGGYEGISSIALIEAKNFLSDDFIVRQLYYPYRLWERKVKKHVRPIFLTYSNSIFSLYEYEFTHPEVYNSIHILKQKKYSIEIEEITLDDIVDK